MEQVKDEKCVNAQNVDSCWDANRSKTCSKLSKKINPNSPQFYKGEIQWN